ncbi:MAG: hypothetical protein H3C28_01605 [Sphingomonadales bacterium]|nr:hypothetical protein [Sphingomonadales bacterium]
MTNSYNKNLSKLRRFGQIGATFLASAAMAGLGATPLAAAEIMGVRVGRHPDMTRVVIDLTQPAPYVLRYDEGAGLTVVLDGAGAPPTAAPLATAGVGVVKEARIDSPGMIHVAFAEPAHVKRVFTQSPDAEYAAYRIVIDLNAAPETPSPATNPSPVAASAPTPTVVAEAAPAATEEEGPAFDDAAFADQSFAKAGAAGGLFDGVSVNGYVEAEGRVFTQDSRDGGQKNQTVSVAAEPSVTYAWNGGRQAITFTPFARLDANDGERSHVDIRELKWVGAFDRLEVRLGIDKVFWGVVESQHLVDILNQDDLLEDIDGEDKLGQPMATLSYDSDFGLFSAYTMTYFRERKFPGPDGRPRGPLLIDTSQTHYQGGHDKWHVDWALRWSHAVGPLDVAASHFHGINRDPAFILGLNSAGDPVLIPRYDIIDQTGFELQATFGGLLLKAEAIRRAQPGENQIAAIAGFEYTAFNILQGSSDLGVLMEYLWDERGRNPDNPFEDDLFAGLRWTANDVADSTLLAGAIFDLDTKTKFVNIEMSRRFGAHWKLSLDARLLLSVPVIDPLYPFADDDFVQVKLQRYF